MTVSLCPGHSRHRQPSSTAYSRTAGELQATARCDPRPGPGYATSRISSLLPTTVSSTVMSVVTATLTRLLSAVAACTTPAPVPGLTQTTSEPRSTSFFCRVMSASQSRSLVPEPSTSPAPGTSTRPSMESNTGTVLTLEWSDSRHTITTLSRPQLTALSSPSLSGMTMNPVTLL